MLGCLGGCLREFICGRTCTCFCHPCRCHHHGCREERREECRPRPKKVCRCEVRCRWVEEERRGHECRHERREERCHGGNREREHEHRCFSHTVEDCRF